MHKIGVAISSGTLKGVFAQGVLSAFEEMGKRFDTYGCASSSVMSGGFAAAGLSREMGLKYWLDAAAIAETSGMSQVALESIQRYGPRITVDLFSGDAPQLLICTSKVTTPEARSLTQGPEARRWGRKLLLEMRRGQCEWIRGNLATVVFDSKSTDGRPLHRENYNAVAYASSRMLHAWEIPAEIEGEAHVDASYTCACPARPLRAAGCSEILVIASQPGAVHTSLVGDDEILAGRYDGTEYRVIQPETDLYQYGVDFVKASPEGIQKGYAVGYEAGRKYLRQSTA